MVLFAIQAGSHLSNPAHRERRMSDPLISVVIPTYNRARPVVSAINSVLNQTYRNVEVLVVDDGSTDATAEAVQSLVGPIHQNSSATPLVRYIYQDNKGQSTARNVGIVQASGSWIAFLDSDDIWLPDKLECQMRTIARFGNSCGACFTDARLTDSKGLDTTALEHAGRYYNDKMVMVPDAVHRLAEAFGGIWLQTVMVRDDVVRQIGFDPDLHFGEDYDFLFRLALVTSICCFNSPMAVIDRTSAHFDPTAEARAWDNVDFRLRGRQYMYEKWLAMPAAYSEEIRATLIRNLRGVHSGWTNWYLEQGLFEEARQAVSTAMSYQATPQLAIKWALTWMAPHLAQRIAPRSAAIL
jgi:glycosyltransferase involved in cell wall biosynthesis